MSRKRITEMVERTCTKVTCDICGEEIPPSVNPSANWLQPNGTDMHDECVNKVVEKALAKYAPKQQSTRLVHEAGEKE